VQNLGAEGCIKKRAELVDENILCIIPFTYTNKRTSIVF